MPPPLPPNYKPTTKECSQSLRYTFSEPELKECGKRLAETHSKLAELERDKKRVTSDFGAKISAVKAEGSSLAEKVSTGYEVRDIACTATMDTPTIGKKRITRNDTGEEVEIIAMTPTENSEATDARAKAEYDHNNPPLELGADAVTEVNGDEKSEEEQSAESNEAANPENTLPEGEQGGESEDENAGDEPDPAPSAKPKKKGKGAKASETKPGDDF